MLFLNQGLEERGIDAEYLITNGNEAGADPCGLHSPSLADQPELKVIIIYVEAIADLPKFKPACRLARAAAQGGSWRSSSANLKSAARRPWRIPARSPERPRRSTRSPANSESFRAGTLDDAVEITELLVHISAPGFGLRLGAITLSGALRGCCIRRRDQQSAIFCRLRRRPRPS